MTKTEATKLAKRARQYGHYHVGQKYYVFCPKNCGERIETSPWLGRELNKHLDAAVVEHLLEDCKRVEENHV